MEVWYFLPLGWVVIAAKSPASTTDAPTCTSSTAVIGAEYWTDLIGTGLVTATTKYNKIY